MKNTISLCLGIIFLMNICAQVFANDPPKGNPLNENPEYYALVRTKFEEIEKTSQNSETACVFSIKPKFWFWSKDYRVVRVHNMPHVLSEEEDGFLRSNLKLFLEARKIATYDSQIATATGKAAAKIFTKKLKARLSNSDDMKVIANFLGTDKETAMESFICAFGMACVSQLLGAGITASLAWMEIFVPLLGLTPPGAVVLVVHNLLNVARFFSTSSKFACEKAINYAIILATIQRIFLHQPDHILDSNAFVTAVDERNFYSAPLWNSWPGRRDDGAWCNFVNIGGLKCAPKARNYRGGQIVKICSEMYSRIMRDANLNLDGTTKKLNGIFPIEYPLTVTVESHSEE